MLSKTFWIVTYFILISVRIASLLIPGLERRLQSQGMLLWFFSSLLLNSQTSSVSLIDLNGFGELFTAGFKLLVPYFA